MKYDYRIQIHPITEKPTGTFQYVYGDMLGVGHWPPEHFQSDRCDSKANNATGWISAKVERIPVLEEGKWYKVQFGNPVIKKVMYCSGGMLHHDSTATCSIPIQRYDIICEMKEVEDE